MAFVLNIHRLTILFTILNFRFRSIESDIVKDIREMQRNLNFKLKVFGKCKCCLKFKINACWKKCVARVGTLLS